jgi:NADH-quinone oxidoreductase subunit C/D
VSPTFEQSIHTDFWSSLAQAFPYQLKRTQDKRATLTIDYDQWILLHQKLHSDWGFFFLLDLYVVDQKDLAETRGQFLLISHLIHLEDFLQLTVETFFDEGETVSSLESVWTQALTYEREISHHFRLNFSKHQSHIKSDGYMRKNWGGDFADESSSRVSKYYDIRVNTSGEVTDFSFQTNSFSLGFEKIAEQMTLSQYLPCFERINSLASSFYSLALCRMVEETHQMIIPERDQAIRMIICELNRVLDHMSCLYQVFVHLELFELAAKCLKAREIIFRLFNGLSGNRSCGGLIRIGGLSFDLKMGWITDCSKHVDILALIVDQLMSATSRSWQWMNMTRIDPTSAKDALKFGVTGPALRACGVNYDLRKIEPYYFYADLAFEVPLGINGDIYDRGLVRIEEMRESLKIIFQLIDNLPRKTKDDKETDQVVHQLSYLDTIYRLGNYGQLPAGEYNSGVESSNGHLSLSVRSNGGEYPYRLRVRTPSFAHKEFLQLKCLGVDSENLELILASYNHNVSEMER